MGNEAEQLQVLEAIDAGQVPDRAMLERNFSEDEQLQLLEALDQKKMADTSALPARMSPNLGAGVLMGKAGMEAPLQREEAGGENVRRAAGVETRKPLPQGRASASVAVDEMRALEEANPSIKFRKVNERPEYLDPETRRWTDVSGFGLQPSDVQESARLLPALGAGIGGAVPASLGPEAWLLAAGSSAIGGAAGEALRLGIGRIAGINQAEDGIAGPSAQAGIEEGIAATIGGGAMRIFNRIVAGPRIDPAEAARILEQGKDAEDVINILRKRGYDIKATPAQLANEKQLLNEEMTARLGLISPGVERDLAAREAKNFEEVSRFFNENLGGRGMLRSREEVGTQIKQQVRTVQQLAVDNPTAAAQQLREGLEKQLAAAGSLNEPLAGREIKGGLERLLGEAEKVEAAAWTRMEQLAGYDEVKAVSDVKIPVDAELAAQFDTAVNEARNALFGFSESGKRRLLPKVKQEEEVILNPFTGETERIPKSGTQPLDFMSLQKGLSDLRAAARRVYKATDPDLPGGRDIARMEKALEEARDRALAKTNPELLAAVKEAEALTTKKYATYKRGLVGDMLREGDNAMPDSRVFRELFRPNNGEAAAEVAAVLSGDQKAMSEARKAILSMYRQEAMPDGKLTGRAHKAFMEKYGDTIDPFLTDLERKQIQGSGNLIETIEKTEARMAARSQAFQRTLEGRLTRMNSEAITEAIFNNSRNKGGSSFSLRDAEDFAKMFKNTPMEERVRESVRDEISRRVLKDGKFVDPEKLDTLFAKTGDFDNEGKLRSIMGDQYIDDLKAISGALKITERRGVRPEAQTREGQTLFGLYRQIVWPPLSHSGAVVRRLQNISLESQRRALAATIADPDKLRDIVRYGHLQIKTEKAAAILASMGAALPETE